MASPAYNFDESKLLWSPVHSGHAICERLRREINMKRGLKLKDYNDLHAYSVSAYTFWLDLWDFMGIIASVPPRPDQIIVPGAIPERPSWFPGTRLNYAENLLWRDDSAIAITAAYEYDLIPARVGKAQFSGVKQYTFHELRELVRVMAAGMRRAGVRVGDRVAAIITNSVTGVVIALAAASIGAIFTNTAKFVRRSFLLHPRQFTPEKLSTFTHKIADVESDLRKGGYGLEKAVVLRSEKTGDLVQVPNCLTIDAFLTPSSAADDYPLTFEQLPFDHPLYILYSSGTSGPPKCIVHAAGSLVPRRVSSRSCKRAMLIHSPSLHHPAPFTGLREITVTGAVLTAQLMTWTHKAFGGNLHIGSSSGGTDVFCAFVTAVLSFPLYAGELQGAALGIAVSVYSPSGQVIPASSCTPGELVITRPHPSIPLYFLNDTPTHDKFLSAYFRSFPPGLDGTPVWRHGDFVVRNPTTGGFVFLGRSDGVLNPSGVRFGSAEIYKLVNGETAGLEAVEDALCVGQRREGEDDERVLLFLKMKEGHKEKLGKELRGRIRRVIREGLSRRHEPAGIFEVKDIPHTVNGKKIEIAVKQIISGIDVVPSGTVANPESFKLYYKYRDFENVMKQEEGIDVRHGPRAKAKL
ncbi:acetoacetate-CoA ligase [Lanmaoa asiatica]|nr:acetoacetate-CoA ligase [Lanmaoa asiatica]